MSESPFLWTMASWLYLFQMCRLPIFAGDIHGHWPTHFLNLHISVWVSIQLLSCHTSHSPSVRGKEADKGKRQTGGFNRPNGSYQKVSASRLIGYCIERKVGKVDEQSYVTKYTSGKEQCY